MEKIWITTGISTDAEQNIIIKPTSEFDGIEISYKEAGDSKYFPTLYLDEKHLQIFIQKMQEMMDYINK